MTPAAVFVKKRLHNERKDFVYRAVILISSFFAKVLTSLL